MLITSFIIISIHLLGKNISDLSVFGLKLEGTNSNRASFMALSLIVYWIFLYVGHLIKDSEINKERTVLLNKQVELFKKVLSHFEQYKDQVTVTNNKIEYQRLNKEFQRVIEQRTRTDKATKLIKNLGRLEKYVPLIFSVWAIYLLVCN